MVSVKTVMATRTRASPFHVRTMGRAAASELAPVIALQRRSAMARYWTTPRVPLHATFEGRSCDDVSAACP